MADQVRTRSGAPEAEPSPPPADAPPAMISMFCAQRPNPVCERACVLAVGGVRGPVLPTGEAAPAASGPIAWSARERPVLCGNRRHAGRACPLAREVERQRGAADALPLDDAILAARATLLVRRVAEERFEEYCAVARGQDHHRTWHQPEDDVSQLLQGRLWRRLVRRQTAWDDHLHFELLWLLPKVHLDNVRAERARAHETELQDSAAEQVGAAPMEDPAEGLARWSAAADLLEDAARILCNAGPRGTGRAGVRLAACRGRVCSRYHLPLDLLAQPDRLLEAMRRLLHDAPEWLTDGGPRDDPQICHDDQAIAAEVNRRYPPTALDAAAVQNHIYNFFALTLKGDLAPLRGAATVWLGPR